jgi:GTP-binding protein HflX
MSRSQKSTRPTAKPRERVLVCGVLMPGQAEEHDGPLSELRELLRASDVEPVGSGIVQRKDTPDPATLMGKGKVAEIAAEVELLEPDAVAVDNDLSPAHIRNLEKAWGVRVLDRSEVILDIFARRARTSQARLQVELAQAEYLLPRLKRMWTHLERMEGAVGTRGPGETQLETDKRLLRKRVQDLKRELEGIAERRQREVRSRSDQFTVGLVGYTNAGKSTLLNRLTGAEELAADMLFATLDTRTRQWRLPDGRAVLLSDTVGFLQRLPHHLVASFQATLAETLHADLLLHVVDASHPDASTQLEAVDRVLDEFAWTDRREVLVFNKIDRVPEPLSLHSLAVGRKNEVVFVSAVTGEGLGRLTELVMRELDSRAITARLRVPLADGRSAALARASGGVQSEELVGEESLTLVLKLSQGSLGNLRRSLGAAVEVEILGGGRDVSERTLAGERRGR